MMMNVVIGSLIEQIKRKGYNLEYIKEVMIGKCIDLQYNETHNIIEVNVLNREYWIKLQKETFSFVEKYQFRWTYSGEKSNRPPGNSILCKMSPEKREKLLQLYKK